MNTKQLSRAGATLAAILLGAPILGSLETTAAAPIAQSANLTVFAAASLTDAFREIGSAYESRTGRTVTFNFGGSSQLRAQLEQGATADVFASADQAQMDRARATGLINGIDVTFATNRLVLIVPLANPGGIKGPADLGRPGLRLVAAGSEAPIGVYTRTMLKKMSQSDGYGADFRERANANVVSLEPNVRQIVAKIQLGEGDAAVVYRSDITPRVASQLEIFDVPDRFNVLASYPIALVAGAVNGDDGSSFVQFILSPTGQAVLASWGFAPVGPTARLGELPGTMG